MNIDEIIVLAKIINRHGNHANISDTDEVLYRRNGGFTVCIIHTMDGEIVGVGATKKHSHDRDSPSLAQIIAFSRAVRDRGE